MTRLLPTRGRFRMGADIQLSNLWLLDVIRALHLRIVGEPNTGKTVLLALLALSDALRGVPVILVDGSGAVTSAFIQLALCHPRGGEVLERFVYFPIRGHRYAHGFPFLVRDERYSAYDHAQILIEAILRITPGLEQVATTMREIGTTTGMALYEAGLQVTEAARFLEDPPFRDTVLARVAPRLPDVVAYYKKYRDGRARELAELSHSFRTKVSPFSFSPELRAITGQDAPTVSFGRVEARRQIVAVDLADAKEYPQQILASVFIDQLSQHVFAKPIASCRPLSLIVDEGATLLAHPGMARDFREFQSQARQRKLWLTIGHQSLHQLAPDIRTGLWSFGTQIVLRQFEFESALEAAHNLLPADPYAKKFSDVHLGGGHPLFMLLGLTATRSVTPLPVAEQMWSHANWIQRLPDRHAIARVYAPSSQGDERPWKTWLMRTPTVPIDRNSNEDVARVKHASLKRFARPLDQALEDSRSRVARLQEEVRTADPKRALRPSA